jgi:hypothetical protein
MGGALTLTRCASEMPLGLKDDGGMVHVGCVAENSGRDQLQQVTPHADFARYMRERWSGLQFSHELQNPWSRLWRQPRVAHVTLCGPRPPHAGLPTRASYYSQGALCMQRFTNADFSRVFDAVRLRGRGDVRLPASCGPPTVRLSIRTFPTQERNCGTLAQTLNPWLNVLSHLVRVHSEATQHSHSRTRSGRSGTSFRAHDRLKPMKRSRLTVLVPRAARSTRFVHRVVSMARSA